VALAKESGQKTLLIDLDLPLGDAALNMGITAEFSTIDALHSAERLDARFLDQLLVKHSSGVWVLAAPGRFLQYQASTTPSTGCCTWRGRSSRTWSSIWGRSWT
jgi:pilus assembly protein CpaE